MFVMVVGAIDYFWNENWHTPLHLEYIEHRNNVAKLLVEAGHLVYRGDMAFKGAWDDRAQVVNDAAIDNCDVMVNVTPHGIPAYGTEAEIERFFGRFEFGPLGFRPQQNFYWVPPGQLDIISHLTVPLDNPYSDVHRKSYTKGKDE